MPAASCEPLQPFAGTSFKNAWIAEGILINDTSASNAQDAAVPKCSNKAVTSQGVISGNTFFKAMVSCTFQGAFFFKN
jgi:hypothetical protein